MPFQLNTQIEADSFFIKDLPLSQCRLINNQNFVWLLLIPRVENISEIIDLNEQQQQQLLKEINLVSKLLKNNFPCDKLNIASIGNYVKQLHVHVVVRKTTDIAWPDPVWGATKKAYDPQQKASVIQRLTTKLI